MLVHFEPEVVDIADTQSGDSRSYYVYYTRHHERVVEQIFANHRSARAVEVHGSDIRWIVRDKEISIYRRHHAQKNPSVDAQRISQRQHGNHYGSLRIDEHRSPHR